MQATGERFIPGESGIIELEHLNRYYFVINQIDLWGKTVLDIASGEGYGSHLLSQHAKETVGVDISNEAIEHANNKYKSNNLKYVQGNATAIPLPNNTFDIVVSFETIEHHDKHKEMMLEIKRVLKNNGILIISSPDKYYYSDLPNYQNKFHVKELYYEEFRDLIKNHFSRSIFYAQRTFVGSIIALDEDSLNYKTPLIIDKKGNSSRLNPIYNIAIGTDDLNFTPKNQIICYREFEQIITDNDLIETERSVRNTNAFKLGKILISPLSYIKHKLSLIR
ncbi:class I SAM-dependent methyltransferase [Paludibacter sp.]|uniref:class I SAM-dependent methyltransferase n=1 Tax=Paludibacter sp. TaxID=1898105 RepID=UPI0013541CEB|nr:class I SAM-dependent methyltransferase [Paludibacter sp.]MTK52601.1 class I SAM-dependent methyltransferase [Paludibacter sp.]